VSAELSKEPARVFPGCSLVSLSLMHSLDSVDRVFNASQLPQDFVKWRWRFGKHGPHLQVVGLQIRKTVRGGDKPQSSRLGGIVIGPGGLEIGALVAHDTREQVEILQSALAGGVRCHLAHVVAVAREPTAHRFFGRSVIFDVQNGGLFPEGPFDFESHHAAGRGGE